jgi:hypothetical protein
MKEKKIDERLNENCRRTRRGIIKFEVMKER